MRTFWPGITLTLAATLIAPPSAAQQAPTTNAQPTLRVFLDCNAHECDFDHVRREITWVTWVRDRTDADLHLLITDQETGSGGQRYTLTYLGRGRLEGTEKSLTFVSQGTETDAEVREGMTRTGAVGLVQFIEQSPARIPTADQLSGGRSLDCGPRTTGPLGSVGLPPGHRGIAGR